MKYTVQISVKEFPWDKHAVGCSFELEAGSAEQARELVINRLTATLPIERNELSWGALEESNA